MNNLPEITLVTRTFQPKTDHQTFDQKKLATEFIEPLKALTHNNTSIKEIIIVTNTEVHNQYAEIPDRFNTPPSHSALKTILCNDETQLLLNGIPIKLISCKQWGKNAGSANALNQALSLVQTPYVMFWSAELSIHAHHISTALSQLKSHKLSVIGFLRNNWKTHYPWNIPQNTGAIWHTAALQSLQGFSLYCDGNNEQYCTLESGQQALIAGMEDYHALLRLLISNKNALWGMIGEDSPIHWQIKSDLRNQIKINRQAKVMEHYLTYFEKKHRLQLNQLLHQNEHRFAFKTKN